MNIGLNTNCTKSQFRKIISLCKKYYKKTEDTTIDFYDLNIVFAFSDYGQLTTKTLREIDFDDNFDYFSLGSNNGGVEIYNQCTNHCLAYFDEIIKELEKIVDSL